MEDIWFVVDYPKLDYQDNEGNFDYLKSRNGKIFKKKLSALGLRENTNYKVLYLYNQVPEPKVVNKWGKIMSYKNPNNKELKPYLEKFNDLVIKEKPKLIIPLGSTSTIHISGSNLSKRQGVPLKHTFVSGENSYETWTLPMYSEEFIAVKPNEFVHQKFSLDLLGSYLKDGEQVFDTNYVPYVELLTMDKVREYLRRPWNTGILSWDLETNTLQSDQKNARPIVFSFSWEAGHGAAIPLQHKEYWGEDGKNAFGEPNLWTDEELKEIYRLIGDLMASPKCRKVGHNIKFDMHFLISTGHCKDFVKVNDTLIGYYLEIDQGTSDSKRLSDLGYSLTTMGGYDEPLEDYKKWLINIVFKEADKLMDERAGARRSKERNKEYQFNEEDREELISRIDWNFLKDNKVYSDRIVKWVIDIITIPLMNKYNSSAKFKTDVEDGSTFTYDWIPMELMYYYAAGDADCCLRVHNRIMDLMKKDKLDPEHKLIDLYNDYYTKLNYALSVVESNGMYMDVDYVKVISEEYAKETNRIIDEIRKFPPVKKLEENKQKLYEMGLEEFSKPPKERDPDKVKLRNRYKGKIPFNPKSTSEKQELFFIFMKETVPHSKDYLTDKGATKPESELDPYDFKTDSKVVIPYLQETTKNKDNKKIFDLMMSYSKINTLRTGFTTKLLALQSNKDSCIHGSFNPHGTETGRLSASQPNLQQLPSEHSSDTRRFDYKYPIKRMFVSRYKGGYIANIDYSNLEMRILGLVTLDPGMYKTFATGGDIHADTAAAAFSVPREDVTKDLRQQAKSVNFGISYGETKFNLAKKLNITPDEAQELIDKIVNSRPRMKKFIEDMHHQVTNYGYVNTMNGFRRMLLEGMSNDQKLVSGAERQSVNTFVQGSGAILTNTAVYYAVEAFKKYNLKSKIIATVHDSIVIDVHPDEAYAAPELVLHIMENLPYPWLMVNVGGKPKRYPITAEMSIGHNYADQVDFDPDEAKKFDSVGQYIEYNRKLGLISDLEDSGQITKIQQKALNERIKQGYPKVFA